VLEPATVFDGDGYREDREAVQEIGGAIERIDDPDELFAAAAPGFLGRKP